MRVKMDTGTVKAFSLKSRQTNPKLNSKSEPEQGEIVKQQYRI